MIRFMNSTHLNHITDDSLKIVRYQLKNEVSVHQALMPGDKVCFSQDMRYLWFSSVFAPNGFLPGGRRAAAVLDLSDDRISVHRDIQPETGFLVSADGEVYWSTTNQILKKKPEVASAVERVIEVPGDMRTFPGFAASQISYSPDKKSLIVDISEADSVSMCSIELRSSALTRWGKYTGGWHKPMANPCHAEKILFLRKNWKEYATGIRHDVERDESGNLKCLWILNQGGETEYVCTGKAFVTAAAWTSAGDAIYYSTTEGFFSVDHTKNTTECLYKGSVQAFSVSANGRYACLDLCTSLSGQPSEWVFLDLESGKTILVSAPAAIFPETASEYGLNAQPRFVAGDKLIAFNIAHGAKLTTAFYCTNDLAALLK